MRGGVCIHLFGMRPAAEITTSGQALVSEVYKKGFANESNDVTGNRAG
jgi:hypothetical protein